MSLQNFTHRKYFLPLVTTSCALSMLTVYHFDRSEHHINSIFGIFCSVNIIIPLAYLYQRCNVNTDNDINDEYQYLN